MGESEAFAAQEPQLEPEPQPEVVLEATPVATPQASPVTSPILEVDGAADADYAAVVTATKSTWDPWLVTAQDIPQPA